MYLEPIRWVRIHLGKIELHGAREMMGLWLRHQARANQDGAQQHCRCGSGACHARARRQRIRNACPCEQRIEARRKKRKSVDSRDGRKLSETQICGRGVTKQIPRKTDFGQMCPRKFECHPEKRRAYAGHVDALAG
ncbi:MAG: hypothetical protein DMG45_21580 [Acidobacteria bacterium]|nr:MAG: hypothetical protein DMG45_21580 [Acidobacteriota bacterium]